jgi:hypothetical protein
MARKRKMYRVAIPCEVYVSVSGRGNALGLALRALKARLDQDRGLAIPFYDDQGEPTDHDARLYLDLERRPYVADVEEQ